MSLKQLISSKLTTTSITFVCGYIFEQGVITFCTSAALCQAEHPVGCHLDQSCRTCVRFLSVLMKGVLNFNGFRKLCFCPVLGNLRWQMCLYVSSNFRDVTISYSNLSQYGDPIIKHASHKQGHVAQIHMFILFNKIF